MSNKNDLWGNIDLSSKDNKPIELLKTQASFLKDKTGDLIHGEVEQETDDNVIYYTFYLVVPSLDNYRYALLKIATGIQPYPIFLYDNSQSKDAISVQERKRVPVSRLIGDPMMFNVLGKKLIDSINYKYVGREIKEPDRIITTYQEFEESLEKILSSHGTISIISSILSKL